MARILLAEDDEAVRALVTRTLMESGYDVVATADGSAALEALARDHGRFDLLLTDIKMPVMDGIALARATARDHPDITILLMTGFADQREYANGLDALIHDVLTKPLSLVQVRDAVKEALTHARR
jgi:two-component system cell cycle response regulator CpdR